MLKRVGLLSVALVLFLNLIAAGTALAEGPQGRSGEQGSLYYLSLGDSLARGVQPDASGQSVPTNQGYADDLFAAAHTRLPNLQLVKLGCPGESTTSMLRGGVCGYPHGSQLAEATSFLGAHRGAVLFVTIDVGSNDINSCLSGNVIDQGCVAAGFTATQTNLPPILHALRHAAGPRVPIAGMTYYDPYLAAWLQGSGGQALARQSEQLGERFNALLKGTYQAAGSPVADVQGAFSTTDFATLVTLPGVGPVPLNVARVCQWTWMCAPSPAGPNIHPNAAGYAVIAQAFVAFLPSGDRE
jgi:lysophospholipase L1-like esterase